MAVAAQGAGRAHFPTTAQVLVFEGLQWQEDGVFASFPGFLETRFGLCKPCRIFASLLESLKPSWDLCKLPRDFVNLGGSLPAMQGLCKPRGFFKASWGLCKPPEVFVEPLQLRWQWGKY